MGKKEIRVGQPYEKLPLGVMRKRRNWKEDGKGRKKESTIGKSMRVRKKDDVYETTREILTRLRAAQSFFFFFMVSFPPSSRSFLIELQKINVEGPADRG